MSMNDREEQRQEEARLARVIEQIDREIERSTATAEGRRGELVGGRKDLLDDLVYDTDDWFEAAVQLTQQAQELSQQARSYRLAQGRAEKLHQLRSSPYFARLDFREEGSTDTETIYLGTMSLADEYSHEIVVYDWRAPVSGMYYDHGPGPASYEAPQGRVEGEMTLKRQFVIRGGKLLSMFDTGITIGDEMLKSMLGKNADAKMKSIVTTIQREQNQIIRETTARHVFVQGAAGSGKTSAALQRVAYLLYKYRDVWTPEQLVLFSPNDVFNDYVSNVLPELGEDRIPQMTFYNYIWLRLRSVRGVEHPYDQLEFLYQDHESPETTARLAGIRHKSSLAFAAELDEYAAGLSRDGVAFRPLTRKDRVLIGEAEMTKLFYGTFGEMKLSRRIEHMQEQLTERLADMERKRAAALLSEVDANAVLSRNGRGAEAGEPTESEEGV